MANVCSPVRLVVMMESSMMPLHGKGQFSIRTLAPCTSADEVLYVQSGHWGLRNFDSHVSVHSTQFYYQKNTLHVAVIISIYSWSTDFFSLPFHRLQLIPTIVAKAEITAPSGSMIIRAFRRDHASRRTCTSIMNVNVR